MPDDQASSELHALLRRGKVLLGCGCDSVSPVVAELAGMIGFDLVWADLEHGPVSWQDAQVFCQGARAGGARAILRVPSADRNHVLHALDVGADVVVVPMIETRDTAQQVVQHGKFAPFGRRGFAGSPRGINYGYGPDKLELIRRANRETHLFVQIETKAALARCAEIVSVEGLTGALVGPADLSFSLGQPLDFGPAFTAQFVEAIRTIRAQGKIAATATGDPELITAAVNAGVQILICASEMVSLRSDWARALREVQSRIGQSD